MTLEQIKEHFKNAKEVECLENRKIFNIDVGGYFERFGFERFGFVFEEKQKGNGCVVLFSINKFAEIISYKDTQQETEEKEYPKEGKVMLVSGNEMDWYKRVVFMEKNNYFISWDSAETIEDAESRVTTMNWKYAKELPKEIKVTKEEIAKWKGCDVEQLIIK